MKAPRFWQSRNSGLGAVLQPLGNLYQKIVQNRLQRPAEYAASIPVICIGNATMGGSGKTPVVQSLVHIMQEAGKNPAVLLRGYGGIEKGPISVDKITHTARCVGDEALLHAQCTLAVVSRNRVDGAQTIEKDDWSTHILMDDGLQNPSLKKDVSFLVVDGENPEGSGRIFPAGPLRETLDDAIRRVQALVIIGNDVQHLATRYNFLLPVFQADLKPHNVMDFAHKPVIAFAGIGRPEKFFQSLRDADAILIDTMSFPDHHAYTNREINKVLAIAHKIGAVPVTTRKDWVRLSSNHRDQVSVLDVALEWRDKDALIAFLRDRKLI